METQQNLWLGKYFPGIPYISMNIERTYIINESNQRIAVQLDIDTFERIENILENYVLAKLMDEDMLDFGYYAVAAS